MKVLIIFAGVLAVVAGETVEKELPSSLTICKLNDPKRDECIRESIETFIPTLRRNQKNAKILILDPFTYDSITLNYKNTNSIVGTFTVRDVRTYGFSRNAKMRKVKTEFTDDTMVIQGELSVPKIFSTGNYTSNMNFNSFKIASQGQYNVTMKDIVSKLSIKGKLETIDGEDYMKVYKFDFVPTIENMKMSLSGLFPDPTLNRVTNEFFNQNWKSFSKEMLPETRKQWEPLLADICNKFFAQYPFRRLLIKD